MATKVLQEYESSLEDLSFNSKPIINMLTMEADKHTESADQIVDLIESRFFKVRPEMKLPLLYLVDSIMKNLNGKYLQLFSRNIVRVFCHAFESLVDPKIRISLYKLRQTWSPYVALKKLAAIDKHVHAIDPNWPITAHEDPNSPTIFLNPKFISPSADKSAGKREQKSSGSKDKAVKNAPSTSPAPKVVNTSPSPPSSPSTSNENVAQKRKQLLKEQKQKKLDKKRSMGLAPPVSKLSPDQKHRSRSQSPGMSTSSISQSKATSAVKNKRRSASPSVQRKANHVPNSNRETGSKSTGIKHHLEPENQQPAEKKARLQEIDEEEKESKPPRSPNVVKPIQLQQLSELPPELLSKHQEYIMKQARKQLESGKLSRQQHEVLVQQVEELYSLHRQHKSPPPLSSEKQTVEPYHSPPHHHALPPEQPHYHDNHPSHHPPHHPPSPPPSHHPPSPPPSHYHRPPSPLSHHRPPSPLPPGYPPPHHPPSPPHHHHPPPPPVHHPPPPHRVYHPEFDNEFPPKRPLRPHPYNYPRRGHRGIQPPYWGGRGGFDRRPHPNDIRPNRRPPPHPVEQRPPPGPREGAVPNMPVDVLLARLKNAGMLPPPSLTFKSDIKQHRQELIDFLLEGESCTSCGLRFSDHRSESYQQHLDWHFQQNRLEREGLLKTSRNWYLHPEDWLSFEELTNGIHNDPLPTLEQKKEEDLTNVEEGRTSCRVLPDEGNEVCDLCQEQLEQFWEEDEDEWHFKDALRTEDNRLFHVYCYQDYKPTPMDASDTSLETAVGGLDQNSFVL